MERCSLRSSTATTVLSPLFPSGSIEKHSVHGKVLKFPNSKGVPNARKLKFLGIRAQASGIYCWSSTFHQLGKWFRFNLSYNLTTGMAFISYLHLSRTDVLRSF